MGYRIEYSEKPMVSDFRSFKSRRLLFSAVFFTLFLILCRTCWPAGWHLIRRTFVPGNPDVTLSAVNAFLQELRWGIPLSDAVETFCKTILLHETIR